jgi:hypothetical protein
MLVVTPQVLTIEIAVVIILPKWLELGVMMLRLILLQLEM